MHGRGCRQQHETRYQLASGRLRPTTTAVNPQDRVVGLEPPGDIHLVHNPGPGLAVSLHVYGADLRTRTTSIGRIYDGQRIRGSIATRSGLVVYFAFHAGRGRATAPPRILLPDHADTSVARPIRNGALGPRQRKEHDR